MKRFFISTVLVALVLVVNFASNALAFLNATSTISWGLTHRGNASIPEIPNGAAELLKDNNGIFVGDKSQNRVYLTFDLGFEAGFTGQVLDELKQHDIKAIFFVCGNYLKENEIINRMLDDGHCIGNHTDRHLDLPKKDEETIKKDIQDLDVKFSLQYPTANFKFKYFRPPFGKFCANTLSQANQLGLKTVLWSNAIADWGKSPIDASKYSDKLVSRLHNGSIILLHITNSGTPKMLSQLIAKAVAAGYQFGDATTL